MTGLRSIVPVLAFTLALPVPVLAQSRPEFWVGGHGRHISARTSSPGTVDGSSGFAWGADGSARWYHLSVRAGYTQGSLEHDASGAVREYVEGFAYVGAILLPFLEVGGGPLIRTYTSSADAGTNPAILRVQLGIPPPQPSVNAEITQRWVLWQLRGRIDAPIYDSEESAVAIRGFAQGWASVSDEVNVSNHLDTVRGGEAGIVVRLAAPVALRLSYAIDEARLSGGRRRDTVETVSLALGLSMGGSARPDQPVTASRARAGNREP
jgi:hypothetical protein